MSSKFEMSFSSSLWDIEEESEEDLAEERELDRPGGGETGDRSVAMVGEKGSSVGEGERGVSARSRLEEFKRV